jgi:hypothetical protein
MGKAEQIDPAAERFLDSADDERTFMQDYVKQINDCMEGDLHVDVEFNVKERTPRKLANAFRAEIQDRIKYIGEYSRKKGRLPRIEDGDKTRASASPKKRSYTQATFDAEFGAYTKLKRSILGKLRKRLNDGDDSKAVKRDAERAFGRNVVCKKLGVKGPAMVTRSKPWQRIAAEFGLNKKAPDGSRTLRSPRAVGGSTSVEHLTDGDTPQEQAIRNETISLVKRRLPPRDADAVIDKLNLGDMTDSEARELVEIQRSAEVKPR